MIYIIGCTYLDSDGSTNEDPIAGEFTSETEAQKYMEQLKADPSITHIWMNTSNNPL